MRIGCIRCLSISLGVTSREDDRRGYPMIPISGFRVGSLDLADDLGATPNVLRCCFYPCLDAETVLHTLSLLSENIPRWGVRGLHISARSTYVTRIQRRLNRTASQDAASIFAYSRRYHLHPAYQYRPTYRPLVVSRFVHVSSYSIWRPRNPLFCK
jgi:hypothetical protein